MKKLSVILTCLNSLCFSANHFKVFFLEVKNEKGQTVILEPDFPYAHMALLVDQYYLVHAHPRTGVQKIDPEEVSQFGEVKEVIPLESGGGGLDIESWVGRPYDFGFSWGDDRFYCSELVAKALGIEPEPMHFDPDLWPPSFWPLEGKPGISPGKIYRKLKTEAFLFKKSR